MSKLQTTETQSAITQEVLDKAHQILFEMFSEVDAIFRKHNVRYCMDSGTLLGAVRHKGFIPWDDDIDLYVYQEDYDKALRVLQAELNSGEYVLHYTHNDPMYWCAFAKVRHLHTVVTYSGYEREDKLKYKGLHIALMRAPQTKRWNRFFYKLAKEFKHEHDYNLHQEGLIAKVKVLVSTIALPFLNAIFNFIEILPGKKIRIMANAAWRGQFYAEDEVFPFCELEFMGKKFFAPKNYLQSIIDTLGADYMTLPPPEKRVVHFNRIEFKEKL